MENIDPAIRNAVRALIIRKSRVLLLRKQGGGQGDRFVLPGGAQDAGETLPEALQRECREEIGTSVEVQRLLNVADYFKPRNTQPPSIRHVVEFFFACSVPDGYQPGNGYRPDKHQVAVVWMELAALEEAPIVPNSLVSYLGDLAGKANYDAASYLGTME